MQHRHGTAWMGADEDAAPAWHATSVFRITAACVLASSKQALFDRQHTSELSCSRLILDAEQQGICFAAKPALFS